MASLFLFVHYRLSIMSNSIPIQDIAAIKGKSWRCEHVRGNDKHLVWSKGMALNWDSARVPITEKTMECQMVLFLKGYSLLVDSTNIEDSSSDFRIQVFADTISIPMKLENAILKCDWNEKLCLLLHIDIMWWYFVLLFDIVNVEHRQYQSALYGNFFTFSQYTRLRNGQCTFHTHFPGRRKSLSGLAVGLGTDVGRVISTH